MPRSNYIYILSGSCIVAAFTVKHELISHLVDHDFPAYTVWRVRDGQTDTGVDITEDIAGEVAAQSLSVNRLGPEGPSLSRVPTTPSCRMVGRGWIGSGFG